MLTAIITFFGLVIFAGWSILGFLRIRGKMSLCETVAVSYGIGMAAVSIEVFFCFLGGIKFGSMLLFAPWVILSIFGIMNKRPACQIAANGEKKPYTGFEIFLVFGISLEVIYAFFRAILYPMESYDSVAIWALKGKAIYLAGGLPIDFLKNVNFATAHPDYPLLIPIQEALFYMMSKGVNDAIVKSIFPTFMLALLIIFYKALRRSLTRKVSLIFTFLLGTIPQFKEYATNGYADLVVAFYYSAGFLFLYLWLREDRKGWLILSALFSVACAWTKNEGIPLCLLNFVLMLMALFIKARRGDKVSTPQAAAAVSFYMLAMAVFIFPWEAFKASHGLKNDIISEGAFSVSAALGNVTRIPAILYAYQKQFFGLKKWNIAWLIFFISLIISYKRVFSERFLLITASLIGAFSLYTAVYILIPNNIGWYLSTTVSRVFLHIAPIAVFWVATAYKELGLER